MEDKKPDAPQPKKGDKASKGFVRVSDALEIAEKAPRSKVGDYCKKINVGKEEKKENKAKKE